MARLKVKKPHTYDIELHLLYKPYTFTNRSITIPHIKSFFFMYSILFAFLFFFLFFDKCCTRVECIFCQLPTKVKTVAFP